MEQRLSAAPASLGAELPAAAGSGTVKRGGWAYRSPLVGGAWQAHLASLLIAFPVLLFLTRSQWFFFDEWDFLTNRGFAGQPLNLFTPHSEHWTTIPIVIYRALFALTGVRSYLPFMAVLFMFHLVVAHLLWRLMLRIGVNPWVATFLSALFVFLGGAWEDLIWAFQICFIGSVAFGLGAMLVADRPGDLSWLRHATVWLLLVAGLMCSGVGVSMVAAVAVAVLLRHGLRDAIVTVSVPASVYVVWLITVGRQGFVGVTFTSDSLLKLPQYIWAGITSTADGATGFVGAGGALVLGILVWLIWHRHDIGTRGLAFAGAIGAVVFFTINGLGRASLGVSEADAPRYVYIATALLLPVAGWIITRVARRDLLAQLAVIIVIAYSGLQGFGQLWTEARANHVLREQSKGQILAAAQLAASGAPTISNLPDPVFAPNLTLAQLSELLKAGDLPPSTGLTAVDRLSAVAALQTSLTDSAEFGLDIARIVSVTGALTSTGADGCLHLESIGGAAYAIRFDFTTRASIGLLSPQTGTLQFFLQQHGDDSVTAHPLSMRLRAGVPEYVNVLTSDATPYIVSAASMLIVCGAVHEP